MLVKRLSSIQDSSANSKLASFWSKVISDGETDQVKVGKIRHFQHSLAII